MTVRELFAGILQDMPAFFNTYKRIFPIIDDLMMLEIRKDTPDEGISGNSLLEDKIIGIHALFADKATHFIKDMVGISRNSSSDCILFVVPEIQEFPGMAYGKSVSSGNSYCGENCGKFFNSFYCKKAEIDEKIENFTLWNGDEKTRIEHYGYDMSPIEDIIDMDVFIYGGIDKTTAACEIFHSLTFFGINADDRTKRIDEILDSLKNSINEIESGEFFEADEVFDKLFADISGEISRNSSKDDKKDIRRVSVSMSMNHRICQNAVAAYWLSNFSSDKQ